MKKEKNKVAVPQKKMGFKTYMKKYWQLYVMLLFPLLYLVILDERKEKWEATFGDTDMLP